MFKRESRARKKGYSIIIGVDEAGRGPLAGPVVAAAVSFQKSPRFTVPIRDSKSLSLKQRLEAFDQIYDQAHVGVGVISEAVIDSLNILKATHIAMENAVSHLLIRLSGALKGEKCLSGKIFILVDGNSFSSDLPYDHQTIVRGDLNVASIMCASIVAKVVRDRILDSYDRIYPQYGFRDHKGYATKRHREAIESFGVCEIHRRSFQLKNYTS